MSYGGYNQGGYGGGYDQGYNQGGGYPPQGGYNQGGGYPPQGPPQGGYGGGYGGGYNQGGGYGGNADNVQIDDNMSVSELTRQFMGDDTSNLDALNNLYVPETGSRDLEGFDADDIERSFQEFQQNTDGGERGLFGFGDGDGAYKKSHQLIGGAAAWSALSWWQQRQKNQGQEVNHGTLKKVLVAFAVAKAIKYWEKSGGLQSGMPRDVVIQQATRDAAGLADTKFADDSQPKYSYNQVSGGEADSFDGPGGNQGGYNQGGYNQGGYNQGGYNQGGYNQGGYGGGYNQGGYGGGY